MSDDDAFGPLALPVLAEPPPPPTGRPSGYNDEVADKILDAIMGGKTLEQVSNTEGLPHKATILRWASRYPEFEKLLEEAFMWRTRLRCDEIIDIADNATGDYTPEPGDADTRPALAFRKNNVVRAKLQIDSRFKVMAAENPRRFAINQPRQPDAPALEPPNPKDVKDTTPQFTRLIDVHPMTEVLAALKRPTSKPQA